MINEEVFVRVFVAQKDACGHQPSKGPACCTNELFDSYATSLGNELKTLSDKHLNQLKQLMSTSNQATTGREIRFIGSIDRRCDFLLYF